MADGAEEISSGNRVPKHAAWADHPHNTINKLDRRLGKGCGSPVDASDVKLITVAIFFWGDLYIFSNGDLSAEMMMTSYCI